MDALRNNQIQARVPLYYKWIIVQLIGKRGKNLSEVVSWILGNWIETREDWLERKGFGEDDFERWRQHGPRAVTDKGNLSVVVDHRLPRRAKNSSEV